MASRTVSRSHWYEVSVIDRRPIHRLVVDFVCIHTVSPSVVVRAAREDRIGQGLGVTMWNG